MKTTHLILMTNFALLSGLSTSAADKAEKPSFEQYLRDSAVPREVIDRFLQGPSWAQYDPELGYILGYQRVEYIRSGDCRGAARQLGGKRYFGVFLSSASWISFSNAVSMAFAPGLPSHLCRITPWESMT